MSVLDIYVKKWNQKSALFKTIIIDFIILIAFLTPMVMFFNPHDLSLQWIGLTFVASVVVVPFFFWNVKNQFHTIDVSDYLALSNEPESTDWHEGWSRKRKILGVVLIIALGILFLLVPLYALLFAEEYSGDRLVFVVMATILIWALAALIGFGIAYEPEMERTLHFGIDVRNAAYIARLLEERSDVENLQVRIMISVSPTSVTIYFFKMQFQLSKISNEIIEVLMESFPGAGTSVSVKVVGRFDIQQMNDAQEYNIGLDYNIGVWIEVKEKEITINVWYPKEEGMKNVKDLGIDEYRKILDFLFQNLEKYENLNAGE